MKVELIAVTKYLRGDGTPEELLEHAGRVCYRSESRGEPGQFLQKRIREGHESLIEHASLTFEISGISRVCSHQLVRHRIASYCIDGDAVTELTNKDRSIKRRTVRELFDMKRHWHSKSRLRLVKLNCLDEGTGRITQSRVRDVAYCGRKKCLEFEVEGGHRLRATKDHLFLTRQGWGRLEDILQEELEIAVNGIPLSRTMATFRPVITWKPIGEIDTYDIVMEGPYHNFIANSIVTHNSQESQRYASMDNPELVVPPSVAQSPEAMRIWDDLTGRMKRAYRDLRALGTKREDARFLLPNATATRIVVTMNFRELLHVFRLRISPQAQWEIRDVCVRMLELAYPIAPNVFGGLREELRTRFPSFFEGT